MRSLRIFVFFIWTAVVGASAGMASADEAFLDLSFGGRTQHLSRDQLLASSDASMIEIPASTDYPYPMHYRAIPLTALIPKQNGKTVQFKANDGFVANIPGDLLYGASQPWLAIETPDAPWPPLKRDGLSAGPFYLVWLMPEKSGILPEQWPYRVVSIAEATELTARYPALLPNTDDNSPEQRGLRVFVNNCSVCHKLNGGGDAEMGPDLNIPLNPTEYFQEAFLRQFIRNPASVRDWGQRIMPGFSSDIIPDARLDDLLAYLYQMARQRPEKTLTSFRRLKPESK